MHKIEFFDIFTLKKVIFQLIFHFNCNKMCTFVAESRLKSMERKRLNRLKVVLAEKNMTNKRLAELVGKDPAMVSKWVTNVAQPNVEMLILISKLLEVSVDDLLWTE